MTPLRQHPKADARFAPVFGAPAPVVRLVDLAPEQAPWVVHPALAWQSIEPQALSLLNHRLACASREVDADALLRFMETTIGTRWRRHLIDDARIRRNLLQALHDAIRWSDWVLLGPVSMGAMLVDWVDAPSSPEGGYWRANDAAKREWVGHLLDAQLRRAYQTRARVRRGKGAPLPAASPTTEPAGVGKQRALSLPKTPEVQTLVTIPELGDAANALLAKSPTLQRDLVQLKKDDWKFSYGEKGKGSFAERASDGPSRITLDGAYKDDPKGTIQTLAHEVGHAKYKYIPDLSNKAACLDAYLSDEGAATLKNIEVQREILANGGPDIGIAGSPGNHAEYNRAYDAYRQSGNASQARSDIGAIFGGGERTSNTEQTYADYYGDWCDKNAGK